MKSPQPRVWVRPNARTPGLIAVIAAMWYAGASQGNGAAYLLCFFIFSLAAVSMIHAWSNLRGISLRSHGIAPVFAMEELRIPILLKSDLKRRAFSLRLQVPEEKAVATAPTLEPDLPAQVELTCVARHRGCYREIPISLSSTYPLGFFTAQSGRILEQTYYVYPAPHGDLPIPREMALTRQPRSGARIAGEDYGGVKVWQPGESQRHIDWKAAARGQPLLTKQWTGEADEVLRFHWDSIGLSDHEARLSQLAKWVVLAERGSATYELRLPGRTFPPSRGEAHYHACLRALAEFNAPNPGTTKLA